MMIDKHILIEELQKATANAIKPDFAKGLLEAQRIALNQRVVLDKPPINPKKVESDENKLINRLLDLALERINYLEVEAISKNVMTDEELQNTLDRAVAHARGILEENEGFRLDKPPINPKKVESDED